CRFRCLLGPLEIRLGLFPAGDVVRDAVDELLVGEGGCRPDQPTVAAVLTPVAVLERERDRALNGDLLRLGDRGGAVVRVDEIEVRRGQELFDAETEGPLPRGVEALEGAVEARD